MPRQATEVRNSDHAPLCESHTRVSKAARTLYRTNGNKATYKVQTLSHKSIQPPMRSNTWETVKESVRKRYSKDSRDLPATPILKEAQKTVSLGRRLENTRTYQSNVSHHITTGEERQERERDPVRTQGGNATEERNASVQQT